MDEEGLLKLAGQIAEGLPEVTRSEWTRWTRIAHEYGLERAIKFAEKLGKDITLRPAIKRSNQLIAKTMQHHVRDLSSLDAVEQNNVLGYVSRILMVKTLRGSYARSQGERLR